MLCNKVAALLFLVCCCGSARAKLFVPTVLSSDMVLPAATADEETKATIWGTATAGANISVIVTGLGQPIARSAISDKNQKWAIDLLVPATMKPATIEISGDGGNRTLERVMFGTLLFCSGQSVKRICQISIVLANSAFIPSVIEHGDHNRCL